MWLVIKGLKTENNRLILKSQQTFRSEKHYLFIQNVNKTALGTNNDTKIKSIDSIETYAYGTNEEIMQKDEITQKEEIK